MKLAGAVVVSLGVVSADAFAAQAFRQVEGGHEWSVVSGHSGEFKEVLVTKSTRALGRMFFYEALDDLKNVAVYQHTLMSDGLGKEDTGALGWLQLELTFGDHESLYLGPSSYITAIQVCTNDKKDSNDAKVKGLRAWGVSLKADGTFSANPTPAEFQRRNCKEWKNKVSCPANAVATGIRGHYIREKKGFAGLALRCTKLEKQP